MRKKHHFMILTALCLCFMAQVSCEPFTLSVFPSYLTEAESFFNMGTAQYFPDPGAVEYYRLTVANPNPTTLTDTLMLVAIYYNGDRRQIILNDDLEVYWDQVNPEFGTRMFMDSAGYYILGTAIGVYGGGTFTWTDLPGVASGPDGYAGLWQNTNTLFPMWSNYGTYNAYPVSPDWQTNVGPTFTISTQVGNEARLIHVKTLYNYNGTANDVTVMAFRNWDDNMGHITAQVQYGTGFGFDNFEWPGAGVNIRLGDVVRVVDEGFICHTLGDNYMHLIDWDRRVISSINYDGRFNEKAFDFGRTGYYYVFDPATRRLFKVRNWWL